MLALYSFKFIYVLRSSYCTMRQEFGDCASSASELPTCMALRMQALECWLLLHLVTSYRRSGCASQ